MASASPPELEQLVVQSVHDYGEYVQNLVDVENALVNQSQTAAAKVNQVGVGDIMVLSPQLRMLRARQRAL
eukprot:6319550-Amphidinium_carterae.3